MNIPFFRYTIAELYNTNIEYLLDISKDNFPMTYKKDIDYSFIAYQLKKQRLKLKKTQKEFANILGVHQSCYSYYEDGLLELLLFLLF